MNTSYTESLLKNLNKKSPTSKNNNRNHLKFFLINVRMMSHLNLKGELIYSSAEIKI